MIIEFLNRRRLITDAEIIMTSAFNRFWDFPNAVYTAKLMIGFFKCEGAMVSDTMRYNSSSTGDRILLQLDILPQIPPPRRLCFHRRLLVCVFVSRNMQKLLDRFSLSQNSVEGGMERNH